MYCIVSSAVLQFFVLPCLGPLLSIVCCGNSELSYTSLCHIELLLDKSPHLYDQDYKTFFAR